MKCIYSSLHRQYYSVFIAFSRNKNAVTEKELKIYLNYKTNLDATDPKNAVSFLDCNVSGYRTNFSGRRPHTK